MDVFEEYPMALDVHRVRSQLHAKDQHQYRNRGNGATTPESLPKRYSCERLSPKCASSNQRVL